MCIRDSITAASGNSVNTDVVGDTSPQLGGDLDTNSNHILLNDTAQLKMGASNDFIIRHNGTDNTLGGNATTKFFNPLLEIYKLDGTKKAAAFNPDGAVELYHNGNLQMQTIDGGFNLQDNKKAEFGNSGDLKIYHDGANSRIADVGTGYLIHTSNGDGVLLQASSGQNLAKFYTGGSVELYHNYTKKFETTSSGATVSGTLSVPTGISSGDITITSSQPKLFLQDNGNDPDWSVKNANGNFVIRDETNSAVRFAINQNSNIECFGDTVPSANNTHDLGTSSLRWANVYTNDLNLSNEGSVNDVDGTWGDWTIQEGESDLFLKNNRSGKKYKFNLTEVS